jgi:trehalose 6-phosphate phosphatase
MKLLKQALAGVAAARRIVVAGDYDGTLAPIVTDPSLALPDRRALAALVGLAEIPDTSVAIISGRSVAVLRELTGAPSGIELIGSHGAEHQAVAVSVDPDVRLDLDNVSERLHRLAEQYPGSRIEEKPMGVAYHYREVAADRHGDAEAAALGIAGDSPNLRTVTGKKVVEMVGTAVNKGTALRAFRDLRGGEVVVFIGDDITDEDAFAALRRRDVGVKIGAGPTAARFRLEDQAEVADVLEVLLNERRARVGDGSGIVEGGK